MLPTRVEEGDLVYVYEEKVSNEPRESTAANV
jgi:hypothetical protein